MILRIIVFADHEIGYRLLEKLISLCKTTELQIVAAVTSEENGEMWWPGIDELCQRGGFPLFRYREPFTETLDFENVDWCFLLSWKHIIPETLINHPSKGVVNLHYSLLPEYRGVYPVNWAIIDGKKVTGVTYHLVNTKIDDGTVICQKEAPIFAHDTARSLQLRLDDLAFELFDTLLDRITKTDSQKSSDIICCQNDGSYKSRNDFNELCEIDLSRNYLAADFLNLLRGMSFLPGSKNAFFIDPITGKRIYISLTIKVDE